MRAADAKPAGSSTSEESLVELGRLVRTRRRELGLTLRELAAATGVSASYIGSIEGARNPTTGRAPAPSVRILSGLADALHLDLQTLLGSGRGGSFGARSHQHALLYTLDGGAGVLQYLAAAYADRVDHWVYICDPRRPITSAAVDGVTVTPITWPLGSDPYPTQLLDPGRIPVRLRAELEMLSDLDGRVGLAITDCSAVMRWVQNPEDEVKFEAAWADAVTQAFDDALGHPPAANVCVYSHTDLEALGLTVDLLAVALRLFRTHDAVAVIDRHGHLITGHHAVSMILREARPRGVSSEAWDEIASAASPALTAT